MGRYVVAVACYGHRKIGLCSLVFAYSPFAAIGIIPIAMASCIKIRGGVKTQFIKFLKTLFQQKILGYPL